MVTLDELKAARQMLMRFMSGADRSEKFALEISVHFHELFPDDDVFDRIVTAMDCYDPAGGEFLYDDELILPICNSILLRLDRLIREQTGDSK